MEVFDRINQDHRDFIGRQPVFFVATAAAGTRINCSPKGLDSLRILDDATVAYLDLGGSGNETHAHLAADGRITIMFCAFDQPPLILRLYGRGRAVLPQDGEFADLAAHFDLFPGTRQIFVVGVDRVQTSCGWGVPRMALEAQRQTLVKFHAQQDPEAYLAGAATRTTSIDGLPIRPRTVIAT